MEKRHVGIVLAGGNGSRMNSSVPKQYMDILGKPVLYYSVKSMQDSFIDDIVIVCREGDEDYINKEIIDKYSFDKVTRVVKGGKERYQSVYNGLVEIQNKYGEDNNSSVYVYIHDGARACVDSDILKTCYDNVLSYNACVPAVDVKDTIKYTDANGFVVSTPDRAVLKSVQTPQCFRLDIILLGYYNMHVASVEGGSEASITDDASIVERYTNTPVKLCSGSYENIKITTPEDIETASRILFGKKN